MERFFRVNAADIDDNGAIFGKMIFFINFGGWFCGTKARKVNAVR